MGVIYYESIKDKMMTIREGVLEMRQHVTVVAALNIGFGLLKLFLAAIALVAIVGGVMISLGFLACLINLVGTLGLRRRLHSAVNCQGGAHDTPLATHYCWML